jgi:hypothetical protein
MIDFDPGHVLGVGEHFVDDDPWSIRQRREADAEYIRGMAALERRKRRERIADDLAVVKAAQKAGLTVTRAPIAGVDLEFAAPAAEGKAAGKTPVNGTAGDFNEWDADLGIQTSPLRQ